jgi:ribosomal protein S18 acetylase RimI-like enzyme
MEPTPTSVARDEERFRARGNDVHSFVADQGATVVGFVVAGPDRDVGPPAGEIWAIYVDPLHWGRGIGSILLGTAVDALRETNRYPIGLWVLEDNAAARGFYEHEGFVWTGERRYIDLGTPLPEIKYELRGRPVTTGG